MPVQHHIHLSPTLGSAPENAPDMKWKVRFDPGFERRDNVFLSLRRATDGTLVTDTLLTKSTGAVFRPRDYRYQLFVRDLGDGYTVDERLDLLASWVGKSIYLVDFNHPNNGADHSAAVKTLFFADKSPERSNGDPGLTFYFIDITLLDPTVNQ